MATGDKLVNLDDLKTLKQYSDVQDSEIKSAFIYGTKAITGQKVGIFQSGYYETREDGTTVIDVTSPNANANWVCTYFPVTEGDTVYIYGEGSSGLYRLYSFLDSSMKAKARSAANLVGLQKVTIPAGIAYIVINTHPTYTGYYALLGENTDATLREGLTAEETARGNADTVLQNEIDSTNMKIPYTYFESGSFNATTGAESDNANAVRSRNFIPFDALYSITGDSGIVHTYLYFYTVNGDYIAQSGNIGNSYNILQKATYLVTYPTIHYVRIRFGDTSNPTTTATMSTQHIAVSVLEQPMLRCGDVETKDIAGKGTNGAYTSSFTHLIPFNGEYKNQIVTCVCKYERESGVTAYPKIYFATGANLNRTSAYELGKEGQYDIKKWRVIRYPGDITDYKVSFEIPTGCTVYIREFFNEYDDEINRGEKGLLIHGHRKMPMTPNDTIHAVLMGAKAGKRSFVEIPKRLSDGTWICYHDDSLVYNDTYIRQANGSQLPSTYNGTLWSAISYETACSWDWGISRGSLFAGTKPMTLNEFFMACAKTGMHPVLSLHPFPTAEQFAEIKAIAKKCGVLDKLELKTGFGNDLAVAYGVFGNEIEEYVFDMPSGERTAQSITNAINALNAFTGCTVKRGIELFSSSAYLAYFGSNQFDPYAMIAQAGFVCALCHQNGEYSPTVPGVSTSIMYGKDFEWWAENHGVTEFTDDYNYSDGLNW